MEYRIDLRWSDEDKAWIAEVPDLPGCMADGATQAEAIAAAQVAAKLWLEVSQGGDSLSLEEEIEHNLAAVEKGEEPEHSWPQARAYILGQSEER